MKSGRGGTTHRKPRVLAPPSGEGRRHFAARPAPKYSRAADPLDVTAPSYLLLNFKPRAEEQPGGGGFLRSPRLLHAGDHHLPAPRVPCAPEDPALQLRRLAPSPPQQRGRLRGRATGGERAPAASTLRPPLPAPGGDGGVQRRQPWEIPLPPGAGLRVQQALGSRRAPPPAPGSRTLDRQRRVIRSARIKGVGRCEPQTRGGREGGGGPGGGLGDRGSRWQRTDGRAD